MSCGFPWFLVIKFMHVMHSVDSLPFNFAATSSSDFTERRQISSEPYVGSISTGFYHTCVLRGGLTVVCWGRNTYGQLGIGQNYSVGDVQTTNPFSAADLGSAVSSITSLVSGGHHSCALRSTGSVVCWGLNSDGQLGIESTTNVGDRAETMGNNLKTVGLGASGAGIGLVAGNLHTCAILSDLSLVCWGHNKDGQLGVGNTGDIGDHIGEMGANLQVTDVGAGLSVLQACAGFSHTCALLSDASIVCWGSNEFGQLGIGSTIVSVGGSVGDMGKHLVKVELGPGNTALNISSGSFHTCAILSNFSVVCWGLNNYGQLGIGSTANVGNVAGGMANLKAVDLAGRTALAVVGGQYHTCALTNNGIIFCWGLNTDGQLGIGNTNTIGDEAWELGKNLQAVSFPSGQSAIAVAAGFGHTCALLETASVVCWGNNQFGQLGIGNTANIGDQPGEMGDNMKFAIIGRSVVTNSDSSGVGVIVGPIIAVFAVLAIIGILLKFRGSSSKDLRPQIQKIELGLPETTPTINVPKTIQTQDRNKPPDLIKSMPISKIPILLSHLCDLPYFRGRSPAVTVQTITSNNIRDYLLDGGDHPAILFPHCFSEFIPLAAISYEWKLSLREVLSYLNFTQLQETGRRFHVDLEKDMEKFRVWIDVFFIDQLAEDLGANLEKAKFVYSTSELHLMLVTHSFFTRAWCLFEMAVRYKADKETLMIESGYAHLQKEGKSLRSEGKFFQSMQATAPADEAKIKRTIVEIFGSADRFDRDMKHFFILAEGQWIGVVDD